MRMVFWTCLAFAAAGAVFGAAVVFGGLYDVSARKGHWPVVHWVLHKSYQSAVSLRARSADDAPELHDPAIIALGARHFEAACAFCHGLPKQPRPATALSMEPTPPHLASLRGNWDAGELHHIIYNGVKMTGMPHWPAARPDEVWPVVAYVMAAADGRVSGEGPPSEGCVGCHGEQGLGIAPGVPRLDIQTPDYLAQSLKAYRDGSRDSGFMEHATSGLTDAMIDDLARRYAAPTTVTAVAEESTIMSEGARLARRGTEDVPACVACHGPSGLRMTPEMPRLSGQKVEYLEAQMMLWKDGMRGGSKRAHLMTMAAQELDESEIARVVEWYSSLHASGQSTGVVKTD